MKMERIKLVVLDMDGTLLVDNHDTSQENIDAIVKLQKQGVKVAVASGRNVKGLKFIVDALGLEEFGGFCVGNNGQELMDYQTGELLVGAKIPFDVAYQAIRYGIDHDFQVFGHADDLRFFYVPQNARLAREWANNNTYDDEIITREKPDMDKVGYFVCDDGAKQVAEEFGKLVGDKVQVLAVNNDTVELAPIGVDKVIGVDALVEKYGYHLEEVLIFGDGQNDINMMSKYPSVAMGNAYPEVKEISEYHTIENHENGVAYFIENYIL
jgi:HAD-superfamily hydrolase, subfamily IIB